MNNYLNYNRYETNQFEDYEEKDYSKKNYHFKYFIIAFLILVVFVLLFLIMGNGSNGLSYQDYEKKLVDAARQYVSENSMYTYNEAYVDSSSLNVSLPSNCSLKSGVIYNSDSYQAYLFCTDYESEIIHNESENIKLIGNTIDFVMKDTEYFDPGYVGNNVDVTGYVLKEEGVYNLFYSQRGSSEALQRKVIVTSSNYLIKEFPYIQLNGDSVVSIKVNEEYQDNGVVATDLKDGIITDSVIKHGNVDVSKAGEYNLVYSVTNNRGYTSSISRKVIVKENKQDLYVVHELSTTEKTGGEVEIIVNVLGDDYYYTIMPDGFDNEDRLLSYTVNENGIYTFEIHDKDDKIINYDVVVSNINKDKPTGTCKVTLYSDRTVINVNSSNSIGYNYFVNGTASGYRLTNTYNSSVVGPILVYVKLLDEYRNEGMIICSFDDQRIKNDPNGITRRVDGSALKMPIADALARRGYTINDLNSCIYKRVQKEGPGTRYGVMAAGAGLIECTKEMTGYIIPYDHTGGKIETGDNGTNYCKFNSDICGKLGVNSRWGYPGGSQNKNYGLNCANFVHWAFCNGGMDMCTKGAAGAGSQASTKYYPEATIINIYRNQAKYSAGEDLTTRYSANQIARMLKPGDVLHRIREDGAALTEHVMLVIGKDNDGVFIAENGQKMRHIPYSGILNSEYKYRLLLLDNYYANKANRNNLYN